MKQTVSIPATDINVVSKSSVLTMWLNRENQLFSSVLEESVSNYNPQIEMFARFKMKSSFHKTKRII